MNTLATPAQLSLLVVWLGAGLTFIGVGLLARRLLRTHVVGADDLLQTFWLGWALVLLGLDLWHFALPIDERAAAAVATLGMAGIAAGGFRPWRDLGKAGLRRWPVVTALAVAALWLSNRCLQGPTFGDAGGYFIPTIQWVKAYPVVPGLGNLYPPYAYNQTYFLYAALLDIGPLARRSSHAVNGLLLLAVITRSIIAWGRCLRSTQPVAVTDLFYAFLLPATVQIGCSILLPVQAPDFGTFIVGIIATEHIVALQADVPSQRRRHLLSAALLAATGVTVKLSFAGFFAAAIPVAALLWWLHCRPSLLGTLRAGVDVAGVVALVLIPWVAGNVVLTGYPLYPSTFGPMPVDWRVQMDVLGSIRDIHYTGDLRVILQHPMWYIRRQSEFGWMRPEVYVPIVIGVACLVLWPFRIAVQALRKRKTPAVVSVLTLAAPIASLALCLLATPEPRYAGAAMWLFGVVATLLAFGGILRTGLLARAAAALIALALAAAPLLEAGAWLPLEKFAVTSPAPVERLSLENGLDLWVPVLGPLCWDAPLPCTPYPNKRLRLRRGQDLAGGFILAPAPADGDTSSAR